MSFQKRTGYKRIYFTIDGQVVVKNKNIFETNLLIIIFNILSFFIGFFHQKISFQFLN